MRRTAAANSASREGQTEHMAPDPERALTERRPCGGATQYTTLPNVHDHPTKDVLSLPFYVRINHNPEWLHKLSVVTAESWTQGYPNFAREINSYARNNVTELP